MTGSRLQEEHRRRSREAAQQMREEFASRQAQALRNKAAAEEDRGHVAIYMPPRPRPRAAQSPPAAEGPPAWRDCRGGQQRMDALRQHERHARLQQDRGAGGRGDDAAAGMGRAAAARRRTEDEQPVGGRSSGNGELSPEQRHVLRCVLSTRREVYKSICAHLIWR